MFLNSLNLYRQKLFILLISLGCFCFLGHVLYGADINKKAPDFKAIDFYGKEHQLSRYKGKIVILEWKNVGCPFVKKHYKSNNMQTLQKEAVDDGMVWLSVVSSAKGKQGYQDFDKTNKQVKKEGSFASAVLIDDTGVLGRLYQAKVTPHMYIIDQKGILVYKGAIDNIRSTKIKDVPIAKNFVKEALLQLRANEPITLPDTKAYGCSIKYK